jgi:DNA-binding GntR family transcriptional regulator
VSTADRPAGLLRPVTQEHQTIQELVVERLREAIVSGQLRPGDKLKARDLAAELEVSTMPVRQALSTLEAEGYISHTPHRSYTVIPATAPEAHTIFLIRVRLEPLASELVAAERTEGDLATLRHLVSRVGDAVERDDFEGFRQADWVLHDALNEACRRPRLIKLIQDVRQSALRYRHLYDVGHQSPEEMRQTQSEHLAMMEAIAAHEKHTAGEMIAAGLHRWIKGLLEELAAE